MEHYKYVKRWNRFFYFDRILPTYMRKGIKVLMYGLDFWWYLLILIARMRYKWKDKKYYLSICAIFKDESLVMKEWVEFHRLVGVDHIYLYNNNSTDNSCEILKPYIDEGFVTLVDWPMPPPSQAQAYNDFKHKFWDETNWVAFIDLDEFICPRRAFNVKDLLEKFRSYPSLLVYWRMFGSSGRIEHDKDKLLTEQYTIAWDKYNDVGKCFFNTRFKSVPTTIKHIHELPAEVSLFGKKFSIPSINESKHFVKYHCHRMGCFWKEDDFTMQINHYVTKSYNEFFVDKKKRGDACNLRNTRTVWPYVYGQLYSSKPDYTINKYLPFLKIRMANGKIKNYFDNEQ